MATGPEAGFEGLLPARPPALSLITVPGVLVTDQEKVSLSDLSGDPNGVNRWENGVTIQPDACLSADDLDRTLVATDYPYWWTCPDGTGQTPAQANVAGSGTKEIADPEALLRFTPYTITQGYFCRAADAASRAAEFEGRARRKLDCVIPRAVEHELWTGQVRNVAGFATPYLADPDNDVAISVAGLGFITALAELEDALGECSCAEPKMIHAERRVVTAWRSRGLVDRSPDGSHLLTTLGTVVVPGVGYPGTGPSQAQSGEGSFNSSYVYGTGRVRVFLSPPAYQGNPVETVTRTVNDWEVRAEVTAIAVFDRCCTVGLPVLLCDEYCGSGS